MRPISLFWLAALAVGAAFWWFVIAALIGWSPEAKADIVGFVMVRAGSIELHPVESSGTTEQQLCATVRPATSGYVFQQWGANKKYMYPTRVVGPVSDTRTICSKATKLLCGQKMYWRTFLIADDKAVLGFNNFGEFTACK